MLALAAHPLGIEVSCLDPASDACAAPVCEHLVGAYDDARLLDELADRVDAVTYEFENVPAESVRVLTGRTSIQPGAAALANAQDRLLEKRLFRTHGIPTPEFAPVDSPGDLREAVSALGLPAVLKTRRLGYDGKGQAVLRGSDDLTDAWQRLGEVPCILESFVAFQREVSMVAVRGSDASVLFYPLSENTHRDGILRLAVSRPSDPAQQTAEELAARLLEALDYVGVVALELFQTEYALLANEFAPRVHNSGHWTIEGAETSQFENHVRAVAGLPLGSTAPVGHAAMVNFIGDVPDAAELLRLPNTHLHMYGKSPRPGRKVGHATVRADDAAALNRLTAPLLDLA
jgi:5-(carboxyamino)imidazole ribonucleotide synthase